MITFSDSNYEERFNGTTPGYGQPSEESNRCGLLPDSTSDDTSPICKPCLRQTLLPLIFEVKVQTYWVLYALQVERWLLVVERMVRFENLC